MNSGGGPSHPGNVPSEHPPNAAVASFSAAPVTGDQAPAPVMNPTVMSASAPVMNPAITSAAAPVMNPAITSTPSPVMNPTVMSAPAPIMVAPANGFFQPGQYWCI